MVEPSHVRFVELAQIGYAVFEHGNALNPHTKGKPLVNCRINPTVFENVWMDHAAPEDLEPIIPFTQDKLAILPRASDVDLGSRFHKRKKGGTEAKGQIL